jgi:NADP-dependent aldehyde dehydrogenase
MSTSSSKVLIAGEWRSGKGTDFFQAENPATGEKLPEKFPVSTAEEVNAAVVAGSDAAEALRTVEPETIARFLESFAQAIEARASELVDLAHSETGLPKAPRLKDVELPRTTDQLRQAARVAREGSWQNPVRDDARKIYSVREPLGGPVVVMGPNNFPYAYNSAAGGDFAAAIVARNPVIAKANPGHPATTRLFAEIAFETAVKSGLPRATVQLIYHAPFDVGFALVSHPLIGATAFTGSKEAGLKLKAAADHAGKPIYLEMSSINPVVILEGALQERGDAIADEFFASCTAAAGQMCTNPGLVILPGSEAGRQFLAASRKKFEAAPPGVLLGRGVLERLQHSVQLLKKHGAEVVCGGEPMPGPSLRFSNTLLSVTAAKFLNAPQELQTEAFGPASLFVWCKNDAERVAVVKSTGGNLTASVYSRGDGSDDLAYAAIEPHLRTRVGRLLNDKMPTGVAVSPAMNHGGPYPATGHPGFTAVGLPAAVERFTALRCYDNVPARRLPIALQPSK